MEMNLEAIMKCFWRYIWRPRSSELGDALRHRDPANAEMALGAAMVITSTPEMCDFEDPPGGDTRVD